MMIRINPEDGEIFDKLRHAFPPGPDSDERKWCKDLHTGCPHSCSRNRGHSGPHRRLVNDTLHLWFDEPKKEEDRVIEVYIRLGVVPVTET